MDLSQLHTQLEAMDRVDSELNRVNELRPLLEEAFEKELKAEKITYWVYTVMVSINLILAMVDVKAYGQMSLICIAFLASSAYFLDRFKTNTDKIIDAQSRHKVLDRHLDGLSEAMQTRRQELEAFVPKTA